MKTMQPVFDYIRMFAFKNLNAVILEVMLIYLLVHVPELHDASVMLLTWIVKHYYDSNVGSAKKDAMLGSALTAAQNTPAATNVTNSDIIIK